MSFCRQSLLLISLLLPWTSEGVEKPLFSCQFWEYPHLSRMAAAADDQWTLGKKSLLFYRVRFSDTVEAEPISKDDAEATLAEANRRFIQMSYGQFSIEWTITPVLQLEHDIEYYRNAGFAGVLYEVQMAAAAAGYNSDDFDLDMAYSPQIPGFPAGQSNIRGKGVLVHQNYPSIFVHELGHSLGLYHANSWDNARAPLTFHATPPFPSNVQEYGENLIFDPASLMGRGDLRSPGRSVEYGDFFDMMGGGQGDFNAAFKSRLHWLAPAQVITVNNSGIYRLYAHDQGTTASDRIYTLRIPRLIDGRGQNFTFRYWISYRTLAPVDITIPTGAQLHWIDDSESYTSQLLDLQPATSLLAWDSALPLGRTYSDWEAGVHITPRAAGSDDGALWIDVQINFDPPAKNRAPSLSLQQQDILPQPEEPIELIATAEDPDGDDLSFFWNFGDGTFAGGSNRVTKLWNKPGRYLVRCEASDGKGGKTARQLLVTVGGSRDFFIQGRILSSDGAPVMGSLVTNGKIGPETGMLPDYAVTETDSDGLFILPRVAPGEYDVGAQAYGWVIGRKDDGGAVRIDSQSLSNIDFVATAVPGATVSCPPAVKEGENIPITFTRTGSTKEDLLLEFLLNGTAGRGQDYIPVTPFRITIPAGQDSVSVDFQALEDLDEDPDEYVLITLLPPGETTRSIPGRDGPREATYYYPGWEPRLIATGEEWFQTSPAFQRGTGSTASFRIIDTTPPGIQRISVLNQSGIAYERPRTTVPLRITRVGSTASPLEIHYTIGGTAVNGIDYDLVPESVTIPAGSDFTEVNISAISDNELEGDETVEFTLSPSDAYHLEGNSYVLMTIQEDEFHSEPQSLRFGFRWGGGIVVQLHGEAGKTYLIESSTDLLQWDSISTNKIDFSPVGVPIEPFTRERRFYRSRQTQ
jgi:hypothetical protein